MKLSRAKQTIERCSAENSDLITKLDKKMTEKNEVRVKHAAMQTPSLEAPDEADTIAAEEVSKLQEEVVALLTQLASREQENLALLQSLGEIKEEHSRTQNSLSDMENQLKQAKEEHQKQQHEREIEHVNSLNSYMDQVSERLQKMESDNTRLAQEKQQLEAQLSALNDDIVKRKAARARIVTVCEKLTQTDPEDSNGVAKLMKNEQDHGVRIRLLEAQLTQERNKCESMAEVVRSEEDESRAQNERERQVLQAYEERSCEIEELKAQLQSEFDDFKTSSDEAAQESEKRILFLTTCVEECSRLVDSPHNEKFTTRDIYETVVALSRNLVVATPKKNQGVKNVKKSRDARATKRVLARAYLPCTAPRMVTHDSQELLHYCAQATSDNSTSGAQIWMMRAAKLEQQLRTAVLMSSSFEDTIRRLEVQIEDLKAELKERMAKELTLMSKNGLLKAEVKSYKSSFSTLSSEYNHVCSELQLRMDERQVNGAEMARMRSALQRKSELLAQSRVNMAQLKDELQKATLRMDQLAGSVKSSSLSAQKAKEHMQTIQNLRRQLENSQAQEYQLAKEIETEKDRNASSQARMKSLRVENTDLRAKLSDLKGKLTVHGSELELSTQTSIANSGHVAKDSRNAPANAQDEVKALRRRVLQKQQLVIGFKAKMAELEADLALLRTKLFDAAQTNREIQLDQVNQKELALRHVAAMKDEMEAIVSGKVYELDGLRASIYDSLEVFVHCSSTKRAGNDSFQSGRSPALSDFSAGMDGSRSSKSGNLSDETMFNLRRWTDFSAGDLNALHVHQSKPKASMPSTHELENQLLSHAERALEYTPEDCRAEICQVLKFIISRERDVYGTNGIAPSH